MGTKVKGSIFQLDLPFSRHAIWPGSKYQHSGVGLLEEVYLPHPYLLTSIWPLRDARAGFRMFCLTLLTVCSSFLFLLMASEGNKKPATGKSL